VLLIFGWLPHHWPFPALGPFARTVSVLSRYTLIWLGEQIESETLHGTGSFRGPSNGTSQNARLLSIDYQIYHNQKIKIVNQTGKSSLLNKTYIFLSCQPTNCPVTQFVAANDWAWLVDHIVFASIGRRRTQTTSIWPMPVVYTICVPFRSFLVHADNVYTICVFLLSFPFIGGCLPNLLHYGGQTS